MVRSVPRFRQLLLGRCAQITTFLLKFLSWKTELHVNMHEVRRIVVISSKTVRNAVSNINPVREDRAARVLVLVLNQQSATISLHFTRLAIAPGQRYFSDGDFVLYTT